MSAAKLLCEIGPIDRFRTDAQLARHAGVAPLDASSGKHQRHRCPARDDEFGLALPEGLALALPLSIALWAVMA